MTEPAADAFESMVARAQEELGVILCTVSLISADRSRTQRIRTTHPVAYPAGGEKRLDPSQTSPRWFAEVVEGRQTFVGVDREAIREFFFDAEVIESLGCGSIINTPVVHDGATVGSVNFLAAEHALGAEHIDRALELTEIIEADVVLRHAAMFRGLTSREHSVAGHPAAAHSAEFSASGRGDRTASA